MVEVFDRLFRLIDVITEKVSKLVCYLVFVMALIIVIEVSRRYLFSQPTIWAWNLNRQIFGIFILVAGSYTMSQNEHIRIDMLHEHFSAKVKMIARVIEAVCLISFLGVLVWQGFWMGWNSFMMGEKATGAFRIPLYPFKLLIPLLVFLFLMQGIVVFFGRED